MHVAQLLPELQEGGAERVVIDLNRELVRRGVTSTVISRGGRLVAQIEKDGGRHIRLEVCSKNPLTFPLRAWRLRRLLAKLTPDLVHVHSRLPAWLLRTVNQRLRLPVVTTAHGLNRPGPYSRILTHGARILCASQAVRAHLQKHYGTPDNIMHVAYSGVDATAFDPARLDCGYIERFRSEHRLDGRFVVTSVGRLAPCKDYETFIRGILAARARIPKIVGVIVGGTNARHRAYERRLHALAHACGAEDAIRFAGQHDEMAEIYALSDVVVSCSSKPESFGRTLVEALAMNTPVIATAHGGALEIVRESIDGFLFPPRDADALAYCLEKVRNQPGGCNLRTSVLQRFALARAITTTVATYREALDIASAPALDGACPPHGIATKAMPVAVLTSLQPSQLPLVTLEHV